VPSFGELQSKTPSLVVDVPVACFAETWPDRPTKPVRIGLRTIADQDIQAARAQAARSANLQQPRTDAPLDVGLTLWVDAYEDCLMRWIVARGTCAPDDTGQSPELWSAAPEDMVREGLTSEGVGFLYDAWERMRVATDPLAPLVDDTELGPELGTLLRAKLAEVASVDRPRATRARKLLAFVLSDLGVPGPGDVDEEADEPSAT
jgi:hypothetical protein